MVTPIGSNAATDTANQSSTATTAKQSSLRQQDFLQLMVAQVKNQDPLQPQANGDFLAQLAQFSTNDGINNMQVSMEKLVNSLQSNQALQASSLVGRKVLVTSDTMSLGAEGGSSASINMVPGLSNLTASIYSGSGQLVKTIPLGKPEAGNFQFTWDGTDNQNQRAAVGDYKIKVNGTYENAQVSVETMTSANVDSVSLGQGADALKLNVAGVGAVTLDKILQISV